MDKLTPQFLDLTEQITSIGLHWHRNAILENSLLNKPSISQTIRQIPKPTGDKAESAIVISAGPSLYKNDILNRIIQCGFKGSIIAIDGSYVRCLKAGIQPDYVVTLDPHPTRMVRWFGDPDFEVNMQGDDYFSRQDLDVAFRNNSIAENLRNIDLVNIHSKGQKLVICSSAPYNVVERTRAAGFDAYWWAPLVDNPKQADSITRQITHATALPAMNTGGTVGTAAWIFALSGIPNIAVVGMDLGYYRADTSLFQTQTYHTLLERVGSEEIGQYFPEFKYPGSGECFYTDPTYFWYRKNMLDLIAANNAIVNNCTGGGTLVGPGVNCMEIEEFCVRAQPSSSIKVA